MDYEWDPRKSEGNATKHGIRFADAVAVFDDERALTIEDPFKDERRFVTIGSMPSLACWSWFTHGAEIRFD
ncbi:MAG: BrnT family toxin [Planctomycetaceae bacterium]|nr:BrnT family toxin [Planctomycetaceae bacterium]